MATNKVFQKDVVDESRKQGVYDFLPMTLHGCIA